MTETTPFPDRRFPLILQPEPQGERDLARFAASHRAELDAKLLEHGALFFRGFDVRSVESFDRYLAAISAERAAYMYRSTPRSSVGDRIYTATEYPAHLEIPLHNENAYQRTWPLRVAFCCLIPAATGGETPLADMTRVSASIGTGLLDRFESRGVRYVRHYSPFIDLPWQVVFQTDDPNVVADYCEAHDLSHEWLDPQTLRTTQVCQGTARHPVSGERVFFNQAHLFHVSSLGPDDAREMIEICGRDRLPRQAYYGDGQEIELDDIAAVATAFRSEARSVAWQAGDVLLLDNMQIAHGRCAYTGQRRVLAALLER